MKSFVYLRNVCRAAAIAWLGLVLAASVRPAAGELLEPVITGIRIEGMSVIVSVRVPPGVRKVTLQCSRRLGTGAWEPRAVMRLEGQGGDVVFELPKTPDLEIVRVRADDSEPLPASFYQGISKFPGIPVSGDFVGGPVVFNGAEGGVAPPGVDSRSVLDAPGGGREVVESDIWQIRDDVLYFFNQYRGLQVIDVRNPDAPAIRGTLPLPAAGEQMYLLAGNEVVLLARNGCGWAGDSSSQVLIVDPEGLAPTVISSLPLQGEIQESRLVGTALYVMTQSYRPVAEDRDGSWQWGTVIYAFDLSNPLSPVERPTLFYAGYGNVLTATDRYLFISVTDNTNGSQVHCIDISAPDGSMIKAGSLRAAGRIPDKFKMHLDGETFTVISEKWSTEFTNGTGRWRPVTTLETFSLADPQAPRKLAELQLADGEQLHATRFDGDRVYVVTFFRVDPLWVVDLSDPTRPVVTGELHVPGWSTYIQPLGDRLVTIGIDDTNGWRVAVSLFDVADPAKPDLLSKVPLGQNSSWSEANSDEKAFGVLPDAGLILVPYSSYSTTQEEGVQLIDFNRDTLTKRGFISHQVQARRSTLHRDRILSISGRELLSVDATDRDNPRVQSETELAWPVNRVFLHNGFLVEVEDSSGWTTGTKPALRVVSAGNPDQVLGSLSLRELPVAGATYQDGRLFLLQGSTTYVPGVVLPGPAPEEKEVTEGTHRTVLVCSIIDLTKLPALEMVGSAELTSSEVFNGSAEPAWPKEDVLVWVTQQPNYWRGWWPLVGGGGGVADIGFRGIWFPPVGYGDSRLYAVDVSAPAAPRFVSEVSLKSTNGWASFSEPFAAENSVFISRQITETLVTGTNLVVVTNVDWVIEPRVVPPSTATPDATQPPPAPDVSVIIGSDGEKVARSLVVTNEQLVYTSRQVTFLEVIDYTAPATPLLREPITIPGALRGLGLNGALLYLVGYKFDTESVTDGTEWLHACAYDGVACHLVDSTALPAQWPRALLVRQPEVYITRPQTDQAGRAVEVWVLDEKGRFVRRAERGLAANATMLGAVGDLLVVQEENGLELFDLNRPTELPPLGASGSLGCVGANIDNAAGSAQEGLWLPLDFYGLYHVPIKR